MSLSLGTMLSVPKLRYSPYPPFLSAPGLGARGALHEAEGEWVPTVTVCNNIGGGFSTVSAAPWQKTGCGLPACAGPVFYECETDTHLNTWVGRDSLTPRGGASRLYAERTGRPEATPPIIPMTRG